MKLDNIYLPHIIKEYIGTKECSENHIGLSNSQVFIFDTFVLKISTFDADILNRVRIAKLEGIIPIPKLYVYAIEDNKIYVIEEKIIGKMLCDKEYMENPDLLYKMVVKVINMLWSVNIDNLDLQLTKDTIINFGKKYNCLGKLDFNEADSVVKNKFNDFEEVLEYLDSNYHCDKLVLSHGDLCLPNILCNGEEVVGLIDLGLMGKADIWLDLADLEKSIKNNFNGTYGPKYDGYEEGKLYKLLGIKKDEEKIEYNYFLDSVLG